MTPSEDHNFIVFANSKARLDYSLYKRGDSHLESHHIVKNTCLAAAYFSFLEVQRVGRFKGSENNTRQSRDVLLKSLHICCARSRMERTQDIYRARSALAHLPDNPMENPNIMSLANRILLKDEYDMLSKELNIKIFSLTPREFQDLLENNGLQVKRIICKVATIPLRFSPQVLHANRHLSRSRVRHLETRIIIL